MQKINRCFGLVAITIVAGALISPSVGIAAPQVLALVATHGGTTLTCDGVVCSAEFSAFCLQQNRSSPPRGTAYRLENAGTLKVIGTTEDGGTIMLDPATDLKFESLRTHVAIRIALPTATLRQYGLKTVSVDIGDNVTLSPIPVPGDRNPQDEAGLAAASGPLRAVGSRIVDSNGDRMAAARLTNRLINDLNANAVPRTDVAQSLWRRAVGETAQVSAGARRMARGAIEMCQYAVERRIGEIKGCLQQHHDRFIDFLNANYWKTIGTGT